ncbi:cupin domain-containing protein [Clostridiaceae bacterium HFYG-1003]|nr:cupin domain-containing protein [Clostridiaceae bacterium HFYG-1003]
MIKKQDDFRIEKSVAHKDGKGEIKIVNFFEKDDFLGKGRFYGKSIIEPGNSIGYHQHVGDQEAYFILKGKARYSDNGTIFELNPGEMAICRDGDFHSIEPIGDETLEYISIILFN